MMFVSILFYLYYYLLYYEYNKTISPARFVAFLTPGARSSESIGKKNLGHKRTGSQMNGRGFFLIDFFNKACNNTASIYLRVVNESMNSIPFRTTEKVNLTCLSYISHKPGLLMTEFKTVACSINESLHFIEIQRENVRMNNIKYHMDILSMTDCKNIIMELKKGLGQRGIKDATKGCFIFDSWISSKRLDESAMDVGSDIIVMVKNQ